jgi:hypothetical protein
VKASPTAILAVLFLLAAAGAAGQDCEHRSNIEFFQHIKVFPPHELKITSFDGKRIEYVLQDNRQTVLGSLSVSPNALMYGQFEKDYRKGEWWVIYCDLHKSLLRVDVYDPPPPRKSPSSSARPSSRQ